MWLIFVLTVLWTGYPEVFGSIASTLSIPFFIAAIGIIMRGGAYALRSGTRAARAARRVDAVVGRLVDSHAVGAGTDRRRHRRRARSRWATPPETWSRAGSTRLSIAIGVIAVAFCAYLAAVFLAPTPRATATPELERRSDPGAGRGRGRRRRRRGRAARAAQRRAAPLPRAAVRAGAAGAYRVGAGRGGDHGAGVPAPVRAGPLQRRPGGGRGDRRLGARAGARTAARASPSNRPRRRATR